MKARIRFHLFLGFVMLSLLHVNQALSQSQTLIWPNGEEFAIFGPNDQIIIDIGRVNFIDYCTTGESDIVFTISDIFIVSNSTLNIGDTLIDVGGTPNTIVATGGNFIGETIGTAEPNGHIPTGLYSVVYDECQNGIFDQEDGIFANTLQVIVPVGIPPIDGYINQLKSQACSLGDYYTSFHTQTQLLLYGVLLLELLEALHAITHANLIPMLYFTHYTFPYSYIPKKAILLALKGESARYKAICADPPDPNYMVLTILDTVRTIPANHPNQLVRQFAEVGNVVNTESSVLKALLQSIERYKGAEQDESNTWALVHAREINMFSKLLTNQLMRTNNQLFDLQSIMGSNDESLDSIVQLHNLYRTEIMENGFASEAIELAEAIGLTANQIGEVYDSIVAADLSGLTTDSVTIVIDLIIDQNEALSEVLDSLIIDMGIVISMFENDLGTPNNMPTAHAGGPYLGVEATEVIFNGSLSTSPSEIVLYEWEFDGDGDFADGYGANAQYTFSQEFTGFIGLRVTNSDGLKDVDYVDVEIELVNYPPEITTTIPVNSGLFLFRDTTYQFSVTVFDSEDDVINYKWYIDDIMITNEPMFEFVPAVEDIGFHFVQVVVYDINVSVDSTRKLWVIFVTPDMDEDGWSVLDECDDANASVYPGAEEICDNLDNNCDGQIDEGFDIDGDGTTSCEGDCDDSNPNVHPGAPEVCNYLDDDCNGLSDDNDPGITGQDTWFTDADGDGFGDPDITILACDQPLGFVSNMDDCDDANASIHPLAQEICNGHDDNCNNLVDDADPGITGQDAWYDDLDGDGFGNSAIQILSCTQPVGYVSDATDCDDSNTNVNPMASEACNGLDDNCNNLIDDQDPEITNAYTWYVDIDGDGFGDPADFVLACTQPAGYVDNADDCNDGDVNINPAMQEVCNGIDDNCDGIMESEVHYTWILNPNVTGNWSNSANWLPNGVPGACDDVTINGIINLDISAAVQNLTFTAGSLGGIMDLQVHGNFIWSGGTMTGVANTIVEGTTTLNNTTNLSARTLIMSGGGATGVNGRVRTYDNCNIVIPAGETFTLNTNGYTQWEGGGASGTITVNGTLVKTGPGNSAFLYQRFNTSGSVRIDQGSIDFNLFGYPCTHNGTTFTISRSSAYLGLAGGTQTFSGCHFEGIGTVALYNSINITSFSGNTWDQDVHLWMQAGTFTLGQDIVLPTHTHLGGTLNGVGNITVIDSVFQNNGVISTSGTWNIEGEFTWSGGTLGGSGSFNVAGITRVNGSPSLSGRTLNMNGGGQTGINGRIYTYGNCRIVIPEEQSLIVNTNDYSLWQGDAAGGTIDVFGSLIKNGIGNSVFFYQKVNTTGTIEINSGMISLIRDGIHQGTSIQIPTSSDIFLLGGGTHTFHQCLLEGAGQFVLAGNVSIPTFTMNTWDPDLHLRIHGGTFTLGQSITLPTFTQLGGNLTGTGSINVIDSVAQSSGVISNTGAWDVAGEFTWSGGTVGGSGSFNVAGKVYINGSPTLSGRTLNMNGGGQTGANGRIYTYANCHIVIPEGQSLIVNTNDYSLWQGDAAGGTIDVFGSLIKNGIGNTVFFYQKVNTKGAIEINKGMISLIRDGVHVGASIQVPTHPEIFLLGGGTHTFHQCQIEGAGQFVLAGNVSIPVFSNNIWDPDLHLRIHGGTFTLSEDLTVQTYAQLGGLLHGTADIAVQDSMMMSDGTINNIGTWDIGDSFTWIGGKIQGIGDISVAGITRPKGGVLNARTIRMNGGGWTDGKIIFENNCRLIIPEGQTFICEKDSYWVGDNTGGHMVVDGTITILGETLVLFTRQRFNVHGTVNIDGGGVTFAWPGTYSGATFNLLSNDLVDFGVEEQSVHSCTFNGIGTVYGKIPIMFSGINTFSPGINGVGILTLYREAFDFPIGELNIEVNSNGGAGVGHDKLTVVGNVMLEEGVVNVTDNSAPFGNYTILTYTGSRIGAFSALNAPMGYSLVYDDAIKAVILNKSAPPDSDNDGFHAGIDCNDNDPAINPGAAEICNGIDDDCDTYTDDADPGLTGQSTFYADTDGDGYGDAGSTTFACEVPEGYVMNDEDCDDTNANIHPEGNETCNLIDDNCDGDVDEGVGTTFYPDTDGDGYGDPGSTIVACDAPEGFVENYGDCDDNNAALHPGAIEACNLIDDDCDGEVDEGVETTFYADADGDGFGNTWSTNSACEMPEGYVSNDQDCDDSRSTTYPGANETCNLIDDDCDGSVDEGLENTFYADADGDGFGNANITASACYPPQGFVSSAGDCNDENATIYPGSIEICNLADDDCDGEIDEGVESVFYRDWDGDGFGNPQITTMECQVPFGYVSNDYDCDDSDPLIHISATEICNTLDDDCDGLIDDADPDVIDLVTWFEDADEDGYGNPDVIETTCYTPAGYVNNDQDCDDTNENIHPGAEICNGLDDDCDGETDEGIGCESSDGDGDGVEDELDNCPSLENPDQQDGDCDGVGDVCDLCPGGDDAIDNDYDGLPDCHFAPVYEDIIEAWKCGNNKVYISHVLGNGNCNTICINYNAVQAHINHGDYLGMCDNISCPEELGSYGDDAVIHSKHIRHSKAFEKSFPVWPDSVGTESDFEDIQVFPNPTSGIAYAQAQGFIGQDVTISVSDVFGNSVASFLVTHMAVPIFEIPTDNFPPGVYLMLINVNGQDIQTTRFVVVD